MIDSIFFGYLAVLAIGLSVLSATVAFVGVRRIRNRPSSPLAEQIGSHKAVLDKVRKGQPMSAEELDFARRIVADRTSPLSIAIPGALFMLGCFYVLGSLEHLHGATPSERTFLGVIPMLTSTNLGLRMLSHVRLKRRLRKLA